MCSDNLCNFNKVSILWNVSTQPWFGAHISSKISAAQVNQGLELNRNYGYELERRNKPFNPRQAA